MNRHDVGRGRGGVAAALGTASLPRSRWPGIDSDRLYPIALQTELGRRSPGGRPLTVIDSQFGHDGFLLEIEQVGTVVAQALR